MNEFYLTRLEIKVEMEDFLNKHQTELTPQHF